MDIHCRQLITFNGVGRAGKTLMAFNLANAGYGERVQAYNVRSRFKKEIYDTLDRTQDETNVELYGIGTLGWVACNFHLHQRKMLKEGKQLIFDHYLADYIVEILGDFDDLNALKKFVNDLGMPFLDIGYHFYLDISYETYLKRADRVDLKGRPFSEEQSVPEDIFTFRRQRYLKLCSDGGEENHLIYIDANVSASEVLQSIVGYLIEIERKIERKKNCSS